MKNVKMGSHLLNLANATEPSVSGGDAALRQITLTTCNDCIDESDGENL